MYTGLKSKRHSAFNRCESEYYSSIVVHQTRWCWQFQLHTRIGYSKLDNMHDY